MKYPWRGIRKGGIAGRELHHLTRKRESCGGSCHSPASATVRPCGGVKRKSAGPCRFRARPRVLCRGASVARSRQNSAVGPKSPAFGLNREAASLKPPRHTIPTRLSRKSLGDEFHA